MAGETRIEDHARMHCVRQDPLVSVLPSKGLAEENICCFGLSIPGPGVMSLASEKFQSSKRKGELV